MDWTRWSVIKSSPLLLIVNMLQQFTTALAAISAAQFALSEPANQARNERMSTKKTRFNAESDTIKWLNPFSKPWTLAP